MLNCCRDATLCAPQTSHKISKYIDYPNIKELFLSLQRRKGDSFRGVEYGTF